MSLIRLTFIMTLLVIIMPDLTQAFYDLKAEMEMGQWVMGHGLTVDP